MSVSLAAIQMPARGAAPVAPQVDLGAPMICNHMLQSVWPPLLVMSAFSVGAASASTDLTQRISRAHLCVTEGTIVAEPASSSFTVDSPKMRAYVNAVPLQSIQAHFTYLGASSREVRLGSGTMRRQFGFKLRAQDACNLVYAMWRIEPDSRVAVSIKRNPGMSTHEQCHAGGYINLKQTGAAEPPKIAVGQTHVLHAEMRGATLVVRADGVEAWRGDLGPVIASFDGPVGLRTDNARFAFDYLVGIAEPGSATPVCRQTPGD